MMLRRFADARLRAELDKTADARDQARDTARRLFRRLQAARADNAAIRAELAAERARTQEPDRLRLRVENSLASFGNMVAPNGCDDCSVEPFEHHRHPNCPGAERARTQETHQ